MISILGNFFKMHDSRDETADKLHRDFFPVITKISTQGDILEVRRAILFKRFFNTQPYPEEVIRIDRSKISQQGIKPTDVVMEQFCDFQFK